MSHSSIAVHDVDKAKMRVTQLEMASVLRLELNDDYELIAFMPTDQFARIQRATEAFNAIMSEQYEIAAPSTSIAAE